MKLNGLAQRLRATAEAPCDTTTAQTVTCGNCGQRFAISHDRPLQDALLAAKQAAWVADQLTWDHIQERKHHGTMELPIL